MDLKEQCAYTNRFGRELHLSRCFYKIIHDYNLSFALDIYHVCEVFIMVGKSSTQYAVWFLKVYHGWTWTGLSCLDFL